MKISFIIWIKRIFPPSDLSQIYVKDGQFVDLDGRIRLFRGINSVIKYFPWYDPKMLDPERQRQLGEWGFNAIRLGAMWSGVEPEQGQVNNKNFFFLYVITIFAELRSMKLTLTFSKKLLMVSRKMESTPTLTCTR